jgi:hypothetical protein
MADWRNVPIREEVLEVIEKRAGKENRSLANMVEVLLKEALEIPA